MHYYKVSAEHIGLTKVYEAADDMEKLPGVNIMAVGQDPIFERHGIWVVFSEEKVDSKLQDIVWKYNGGAWCEQTEVSEEYADSMC